MTKRILSVALAVLFVFSVILSMVACQDENSETSTTDGVTDDISNSEDSKVSDFEATSEISDPIEIGIPEPPSETSEPDFEIKYFDNAKVNILGYLGSKPYSTYAAEQIDAETSDDPIIYALSKRNEFIKENCGIDINLVLPESGEDALELLKADMKSGANEIHAVVNSINNLAPLAAEGLLTDFRSIDNGYIKLTKPWWEQSPLGDLSINGKTYFLTGDALIQDNENTWVMFFNNDLVEEYNLEDPYQMFMDRNWTFDTMYEMLQKVELTNREYKSYDPASGDKWGMVVGSYDINQFMYAADQRTVEIDHHKNIPVLRIDTKLNVDTFNNIAKWFILDNKNVGVDDYFGRWDGTIQDRKLELFANGNALFMPNSVSKLWTPEMQNSKVNFGILPMPRGSENQPMYYSGVNSYMCDVISIPVTNVGDSLDVTCYALEAMAYAGNKVVTPAYYETILENTPYKNDLMSATIIENVFKNRVYDMGAAFNFHGEKEHIGTLYFYTDLVGNKSTDIISWYNQCKDSYQAGIDALIAQCYQ